LNVAADMFTTTGHVDPAITNTHIQTQTEIRARPKNAGHYSLTEWYAL